MFLLDRTPCPIPPETHEWLKIFASTIGGMIAGLISGLVAEPIRTNIKRKSDIRRVEKAIQFDRLIVNIALEAFKRGLVSSDDFWGNIDFPGFEYYWEKNRELFYDSLALQMMRAKCEEAMALSKSALVGNTLSTEAISRLPEILNEIQKANEHIDESDLSLKTLKQRILHKYSPHTWSWLKRISNRLGKHPRA
jgi:hypothetical protein